MFKLGIVCLALVPAIAMTWFVSLMVASLSAVGS
jgi:hypothetical protein